MEAGVTAPDIALRLIQGKAEVNATDIRGNAALHHLVSRAKHQRVSELVSILINSNADPHISNNFGDSAITLASRHGFEIEF